MRWKGNSISQKDATDAMLTSFCLPSVKIWNAVTMDKINRDRHACESATHRQCASLAKKKSVYLPSSFANFQAASTQEVNKFVLYDGK